MGAYCPDVSMHFSILWEKASVYAHQKTFGWRVHFVAVFDDQKLMKKERKVLIIVKLPNMGERNEGRDSGRVYSLVVASSDH